MSGNRVLSWALAAVCALPLATRGDASSVAFDFSATEEDRVFLDVPIGGKNSPGPAALLLTGLSLSTPSAVRAATFHLRSGDGWWTAQVPPSALRGNLRIPFGDFAPEDAPGPAADADLLRVSLWRSSTPGAGELRFQDASLAPPASVAILRGTNDTAPKESALAEAMAARCARLLARAGIPFDTLSDDALADVSALQDRRAVLLPYNPRLTTKHLATLRAFVRGGGYVVAFYNATPGLSELLGLGPPRWEEAPKGASWPAIQAGDRRIPYPTVNRICPVPRKGASVVATWVSPEGKTTADPAVVSTEHGALFAHLPPLAYPAAQQLLAALGGVLGENAPRPLPGGALPRPFPLAAWSRGTAGLGSPARDAWSTLSTLYLLGGTSRDTVPKPGGTASEGDGSAAPAGPAVHTWLPCLHAPSGRWLSASAPADRVAVLARVRKAARTNPAGLHFDYLRTPEGIAASPEETAAVTALLRDAAAAARKEAPGIVLSAAVFPTPSAAAAHNQDWPTWVKEGLVDYVAPMLYYDDPEDFRSALAQCVAAVPAERVVAGIGTGADESQASPEAVREEIAAAAEAGCRGAAFFMLDEYLLELLSAPISE